MTDTAGKPVVIESFPVETIYVDDIHSIYVDGPLTTFTFYEDVRSALDGSVERHIKTRIMIRTERVPHCARRAIEETATHLAGVIAKTVRSVLNMH